METFRSVEASDSSRDRRSLRLGEVSAEPTPPNKTLQPTSRALKVIRIFQPFARAACG